MSEVKMLLKISNSRSFLTFFLQFQSSFLFMLIPHPWDYQELSDLPCFADGTMWETEAKVGNFHFLMLKNCHLCPDP